MKDLMCLRGLCGRRGAPPPLRCMWLLLLWVVCLMTPPLSKAEGIPEGIDLYLYGANVNGKSWQYAQPDAKFTYQGDGIYIWSGEVLWTDFRLNDGNWMNVDHDWGYPINASGDAIIDKWGMNYGLNGFYYILNPQIVVNCKTGIISLKGGQFNEFNQVGATDNLLSIAEVRSMELPLHTVPVYMQGYIVGYSQTGNIADGKIGVPDESVTHVPTILMADSPSETDLSNCLPMAVPVSAATGPWCTPSLDRNGRHTFDFSTAEEFVPIMVSDGVLALMQQTGKGIVTDYMLDNENNNLWLWDNTYVPASADGVNSFGYEESYISLTVGNNGWSGCAIAIDKTNDRYFYDSDDYVLHFALKGNDPTNHVGHTIMIDDMYFNIGRYGGQMSQTSTTIGNTILPTLGDLPQNNEWYSYDIPLKIILKYANVVGKTTPKNIFGLLSGGIAGTPVQFDNVFIYKKNSIADPRPEDNHIKYNADLARNHGLLGQWFAVGGDWENYAGTTGFSYLYAHSAHDTDIPAQPANPDQPGVPGPIEPYEPDRPLVVNAVLPADGTTIDANNEGDLEDFFVSFFNEIAFNDTSLNVTLTKDDGTETVLDQITIVNLWKYGYCLQITLGENDLKSTGSYTLTIPAGLVKSPATGATNKTLTYHYKYVEAEPDVPEFDVYILGTNVNGKTWALKQDDCKFTYQGKGIYTWDGEVLGTEFKLNDGSWDILRHDWGGDGANPYIYPDTEYFLVNGGANILLGQQYSKVNKPHVVFNSNDNTITLTGEDFGNYEIDNGDVCYLIGAIANYDWVPMEGLMMTKLSDGVYSTVVDFNGKYSPFGITTKLGSTWDEINYHRFGPLSDGDELVVGTQPMYQMDYPMIDALAWYSYLDGKYTLTADFNAMTLTVEKYSETTPEPGTPEIKIAVDPASGSTETFPETFTLSFSGTRDGHALTSIEKNSLVSNPIIVYEPGQESGTQCSAVFNGCTITVTATSINRNLKGEYLIELRNQGVRAKFADDTSVLCSGSSFKYNTASVTPPPPAVLTPTSIYPADGATVDANKGGSLSKLIIHFDEPIELTDSDIRLILTKDNGDEIESEELFISNTTDMAFQLTVPFHEDRISGSGTYTLSIPVGLIHGMESGGFNEDLSYSYNYIEKTSVTPHATYAAKAVTLSCDDADASIFYCVDADPKTSSPTLYREPIPVYYDCTINFFAQSGTGQDSETVSYEFVKSEWQVPAPVFLHDHRNGRLTVIAEPQSSLAADTLYVYPNGSASQRLISLSGSQVVEINGDMNIDHVTARATSSNPDLFDSEESLTDINCNRVHEFMYDGRYLTQNNEEFSIVDISIQSGDAVVPTGIVKSADLPCLFDVTVRIVSDEAYPSKGIAYSNPGYFDGIRAELREAGAMRGILGWTHHTDTPFWPTAERVELAGPLNDDDFFEMRTIFNVRTLDLTDAEISRIPDYALSAIGTTEPTLLELHLPTTLTEGSEHALAGNKNLTAVHASAKMPEDAKVPEGIMTSVGNPNVLLFVAHEGQAPADARLVAVGTGDTREIKELTLVDHAPFRTPLPLHTDKVSLVRDFAQQTPAPGSGLNMSAGWESIVLPFDVASIIHETQGAVTPFMFYNSEDATGRPFWLFSASTEGWEPSGAIHKGIPYLISMPCSEEYVSDYNLDGNVTFSATDVTIRPTDCESVSVPWTQGRTFNSLFLYPDHETQSNGLVINVGYEVEDEDGNYLAPGSTFSWVSVFDPFTAYVTRLDAQEKFLPVWNGDKSDVPVLADASLCAEVTAEGLRLTSLRDRTVEVFSSTGVRVAVATLRAAEPQTLHLVPGIYIVAGRKVLL